MFPATDPLQQSKVESRESVAGFVVADVFLFEAERFGGVEDEHLHADVLGDRCAGELGHHNHEADGSGYGPDGRLFAEDAEQGMVGPVVGQGVRLDRHEPARFGHAERLELGGLRGDESGPTGQRDRRHGEQPTREHSG